MKFTVDRKTWVTASTEGNIDTISDDTGCNNKGEISLLNEEGNMCCLGHCAVSMGVLNPYIRNEPAPEDLIDHNDGDDKVKSYLKIFAPLGNNNSLSLEAMRINDNYTFTDSMRETKLIELFAKHGHELVFRGDK